ncbi:hypothetical protein, partial [Bacillus sp. WP8]|uniref:hypothetical protein n=1 Tax=Bacillus sp. WP8 TaxID=756828 RepID=UPI001C92C9B9
MSTGNMVGKGIGERKGNNKCGGRGCGRRGGGIFGGGCGGVMGCVGRKGGGGKGRKRVSRKKMGTM